MAEKILWWIFTIGLAFALLSAYEMVEELIRYWLRAGRVKRRLLVKWKLDLPSSQRRDELTKAAMRQKPNF